MPRIGLIGGTGFAALHHDAQRILVETPWGDVPLHHRREGDLDLFLLHRHGEPPVPPHRILHRANVDALARCHVDAILALNAVGALHPDLPPGTLLVPDDWLDQRRHHETFHDATPPTHVDVSQPYCPTLRALLLRHATAHGAPARDGGVYVATDGPRLETRAEVRALRNLGGTVVGMTGLPEAALARERGLCYASLCLVVNPAAGVSPTAATLRAHDIRHGAEALAPTALRIALAAAHDAPATHSSACTCRHALEGATL